MKKKEAEMDFIGGAGPLTKSEEQLISDFISAKKKKAHSKKRTVQPGPGEKVEIKTKTYAHR